MAQKALGFQRGVRRDEALGARGGAGADDIAEGAVGAEAEEAAGLPAAEIVLNAAVQRPAEQHPGLPHGARHDADILELGMGVLGPVAAAHGHGEADERAPCFEATLGHGGGDDMGEQRIAGDHDVGAGNDGAAKQHREPQEEGVQPQPVGGAQGGEARQGGALMAVKGGRDAPDAATAGAQLALLEGAVFDEPVGRIGDDRMDRGRRTLGEPVEAVGMVQNGLALDEGRGLAAWDGGGRCRRDGSGRDRCGGRFRAR